VEHRALLQPSAHLVNAEDAQVRARIHGPGRQAIMKGKVGAPRLVDDQREAPLVAQPPDRGDVGAGSIRRGAGDQNSGDVGIAVQGPPDLRMRPWRPATASMALLTESELPQVEKNA
jgi:hypothetical protein